MKLKMKRFLEILLSLTLVLGLVPGMSMTAYAANYSEGEEASIFSISVGDTFDAGSKITRDNSAGVVQEIYVDDYFVFKYYGPGTYTVNENLTLTAVDGVKYYFDSTDTNDLTNATVTVDTANASTTVKIGDKNVGPAKYDVKYGSTPENATADFPTQAGSYYAFVTAKETADNYIGEAKSAVFTISAADTVTWTSIANNKSENGITVTTSDVVFSGNYISGYNGSMTFTSTVGKIKKIEISGNGNMYVYGTSSGWNECSRSGPLVWNGTASDSVTLSAQIIDIMNFSQAVFTIEAQSDISDTTVTVDTDNQTVSVTRGNAFIPEDEYTVTYGADAEHATLTDFPTKAGTYVAVVTAKTDSIYYKGAVTSAEFTIPKADVSIISLPTASAITYGQTLADSALTGGTAKSGDSAVEGTFTWKNGEIKPTVSDSDATEYYVAFTPTDADNYAMVECKVKLTVNKAAPTVTAPTAKTGLVYTSSAQKLVNTGSTNDGILYYAVTTENTAPTDDNLYSTSIPTGTDVGTYYVWYKVVGDTNHNDTTPSKVEVNIKPADVKVTAPTAINSTYNGKEQALVNAGVTEDGKVFYRLGTDGTWTDTVPTAKNVGEYEVYYYVDGDDNHSDSGSAKEPLGSVKVTIAKKTVTVSGITAEGKEYDGNTGATISTENATLAGLVDGDTLTVAAKGTFSDANAGNGKKVNITDITLVGTSVDNYVLAEEGQQKEATANITPKAVTVTPDAGQSKVYGAADPAFKYTAEGIVGEEKLSGALERTAGDSVGEYAYTIGTLDSANANYNVSIAENAPKFEIKKAALTVTAEAKNITYGDEDVILTYKVDGLAKDDTADKVLTGALTREAGTDAGTYKITQGNLTSANYSITFVGADYVIAKAAQAAPTGTFTTSKATGSDTADGKISGFEATKVYQISSDDGATWTDVEAESTSIDVKAGAYQIRYTGDKNHEPGASVSVTVEKKADQSKPEGLEIENVSAENATDGSITGVTDDMEYSTDDGKTWKAVPANADKIEGLAVGEVLVRYTGNDDKNASPATAVTVGVASKTEGVVDFSPEESGSGEEEKAVTGVDDETTKASVDDFAETQQEDGRDVKVALEITPQKKENVNKESVEETNKVVEEVFAGIVSEKVVTEYLAIDVAKYVDNVKETENISDTKSPLEIALRFDSTKSNPVVIRTHDGEAKAFGKLKSRPAKKDYKDGMFYIDMENAILYIYSQYFSDFAIVYARETTYNVGFVSGTDASLPPLVVAEGGRITLSDDFFAKLKNDGCTFDGWYKDEAYTSIWNIDTDTVNSDITLYAKWNKSVSGVSVSPSEVKFTKAGETSQIKVTVTPADAANTKVTYKSSDTKVATVDANGKITAVANGTSTITVTTEDGAKTATVKVTVAIPDVPKQGTSEQTTTEQPVQEPTKEEKAEISMNAGLKINQTGSKINIKWGKVGKADGYDVYVAYCGKKFGKAVKTINKNSTISITVKKINGKKINLKKNFKVYVAAYKMTDGKKEVLAKSIMGHVVGRLNTRYSNAKKITLSKSKYSVKVGKTAKVKAKTVLVDKSKKQLSDAHAAQFRYASSNRNIATVDKNGKVKGIAKGTCTIYVYARNGYAKTVKVTVK